MMLLKNDAWDWFVGLQQDFLLDGGTRAHWEREKHHGVMTLFVTDLVIAVL